MITIIGYFYPSREAYIQTHRYSGHDDYDFISVIFENFETYDTAYQFVAAYEGEYDFIGRIESLPIGPPVWTPPNMAPQLFTVFGFDSHIEEGGREFTDQVKERDWVTAAHWAWVEHGITYEPVAIIKGQPKKKVIGWVDLIKSLKEHAKTGRTTLPPIAKKLTTGGGGKTRGHK